MTRKAQEVPCTVSPGDVAAGLVHQVQRGALLVSLEHEQGLVHQLPLHIMYCLFPVICDPKNLMACLEVILEAVGSPYGHSESLNRPVLGPVCSSHILI